MSYLVCVVPVCPMRFEPSHKSEQVSQLLFGDVVRIVESGNDFIQVKHLYDGYEGWSQRSQLEEINPQQFENYTQKLTTDFLNIIKVNSGLMQIPMGCSVGHIHNRKQVWGNVTVEYQGKCVEVKPATLPQEVIQTQAMAFVNTSYQWGGRSVFGVDCSGFTQSVFRFAGIALLRDAYQQAQQGEAIGFLEEARCGDLAFFDNAEQRITHVGILLDPSTIVHASGKVRMDTIDHQGIINNETGLRTHQLRVIKRLL